LKPGFATAFDRSKKAIDSICYASSPAPLT
jgi:hypothetical protein